MKNENTYQKLDTDFSLDDEFDPLEDLSSDEDEDQEFSGYVGTGELDEVIEKKIDDRPAQVRIEELITRMAPRRKVLLKTIAFCHEQQVIAAVNDFIDELQANNASVYSAATLCSLLEEAGALERVTAEGEAANDLDVEPEIVVVDGVEYLESKDPIELFWVATPEGTEIVEADKPLERLSDLFEADALYKPIYKRILTLCDQEDGATTPLINENVDHDPLVQEPRLYAPHFIDKLEKCDALTWKKKWVATEIGKAGLELLVDVEDSLETIEVKEA